MSEYIYGLIDPTNQMISYIGRSADPLTRWEAHIQDDGDTIKTRWIGRLQAIGVKPVVVILEEVDDSKSVAEVERLWVDMGVRLGWPIVNTLLINGPKYRRREIDRFSESIADWLITNHLDSIVSKLADRLAGKALQDAFSDKNLKDPPPEDFDFENVLKATGVLFPLDKKRPLYEDEYPAVRALAESMSKNQLCFVIYGSKSSRYMDWINQALET